MYDMKLLVTGGAGFIGSALIRHLIQKTNYQLVNVDCLTYASNLKSLDIIKNSEKYQFFKVDICDKEAMFNVFEQTKPDALLHLAAESHVDKSIHSSGSFIQTNILGTYHLLEISRNYWQQLPKQKQDGFRFLHISTDEVFGDLESDEHPFNEYSPYRPSSPYSASKAASDHLVRAWHRTFGLPILISNCSNNYGPYQFPEKLIPLTILNALRNKPIPVYGDGTQIRDWLHVDDHVRALQMILEQGHVGESFNIGGHNELKNIELVEKICFLIDELLDRNAGSTRNLIQFVQDRPGHDKRYAIDSTKLMKELDWRPQVDFEVGLKSTIMWYLNHSKIAECVE